ncbi:unnamed protein product [Owenia fusiformis]|uniref:Uncharacterized protein n=1 Tax=Owenia fusiformis TaxID=6347 RepID=A0A8J1TFH8_OWEFU|nr:unnamed protein product [Owenia fusiformis]
MLFSTNILCLCRIYFNMFRMTTQVVDTRACLIMCLFLASTYTQAQEDIDTDETDLLDYTIGNYVNKMADGSCLILTNWRNRINQPWLFYNHTEECSGGSQTICEMKRPVTGCPLTFRDIEIQNSCYKVERGWRPHDRANALCQYLHPNARLVHVSTQAEMYALGNELSMSKQTRCGGTAEFTQGLVEPPDA